MPLELEKEELEVMTADEIADLLRVGRATVYRWAAEGSIPCLRVRRTVRFDKLSVLEAVKKNGK